MDKKQHFECFCMHKARMIFLEITSEKDENKFIKKTKAGVIEEGTKYIHNYDFEFDETNEFYNQRKEILLEQFLKIVNQ